MLFFILLSILFIPMVPITIRTFFLLVKTRCKSNVCLVGKTALVTGGNSDRGIGYQIVLQLASRGCRVIIADKNQDPDLTEKIIRETNNPHIVYHHVDLASFKSVREFANCIVESEEKLDILIHNAGLARTEPIITEDGLDMCMQVNFFSPFLLTHLLVDLLKKSSGRLIFTGSVAAYPFSFRLENLLPNKANEGNSSFIEYCHSKFCVLVIAELFAQKLKKFKITSNTYHPGIVYSNIFKEAVKDNKLIINIHSFMLKIMAIGTSLSGLTAEEGAQTAIHLACANEVKDMTGLFFFQSKPTFKPRQVYDEKLCNAVWKTSEEIVKLEPHEKL